MLTNVSFSTIVFRILMTLFISCVFEEHRLLSRAGMCPPTRVLYPCECFDNRITCGQQIKYSVKHIFKELSDYLSKNERHFSAFVFENSVIEEFEDNMFGNIFFENITIINAINLTKIKSNSFNNTAQSVRHFEQRGETKLGTKYSNQLFDALSSLINVRHISLELNLMKALPMYAFSNDVRVEWFSLRADSLTRIENYAFYELHNLRHIRVKADRLIRIAAHSFDFQMPSNQFINIDLRNNRLTEYSFEIESFIGTKRPINLMLMYNDLTFLDEKSFGPLLHQDMRHVINLDGNPLYCNCSMAWLFRDRDVFVHQVKNAFCNGLADIWSLDESNFVNCLLDDNYAPKLVIRSESFRTDPNFIAILIILLVLEFTLFSESYLMFGL